MTQASNWAFVARLPWDRLRYRAGRFSANNMNEDTKAHVSAACQTIVNLRRTMTNEVGPALGPELPRAAKTDGQTSGPNLRRRIARTFSLQNCSPADISRTALKATSEKQDSEASSEQIR